MRPEISVILPTYNRSGSPAHFTYLQQCVKSLLAQDVDVPYELLVGTEVPQANWPNVSAYLEGLVARDDRVKIVLQHHQPMTGHGPVDNDLHALARGKYCTRPLGDDEIFAPNFLRALHGALEAAPDAALAYGDFVDIDAAGNILCERRRGEHSVERLKEECYVGICVMYPRWAYDRAGGYKAMLAAEDYEMWRRMAELGPFVHVPEFLGRWRDWSGNLTAQVRAGAIEQEKVYLEEENRP